MPQPISDPQSRPVTAPHSLMVMMERLDQHVHSCGETNKQVQLSLDRLEVKVNAEFDKAERKREKIHRRIDEMDLRFRNRYHNAVFGIIAVLLSVCGYLIAKTII